jgi:hypothetical protein
MLIQHERAKVDTIVQSMAASLARYGKLSDAQAKLAKSILDRWLKPAAEVPLCNERTRVRGVVLSVKEKDHPTMLLYNALIEVTAPCGGTYRLWGTRPTIRGARYEEGCNANVVQKGDTVEFDAIITRSDRDRAFGFFNRATKVKIISKFVPPEVV